MRGKLLSLSSGLLLALGLPSIVLGGSVAERGFSASSSFFHGRIWSPERPAARPPAAKSPMRFVAKSRLRPRPRLRAATLAASAAGPSDAELLALVDQSDILPRHRALADDVLRSMPPACLANIKNFYVRYDHPAQRGLAGKESIIISGNLSDAEFRAILIHEFSHSADLGCIRGTAASGPSAFRDGTEVIWNDDPSVAFYEISWAATGVQRSGTREEDFVSGYASWDPFEDLAESVTYYVLHRPAFAERARGNAALAAKLAWIETHLFPRGIDAAASEHAWNGTVPWDVTKLSYRWNRG